MLSDVPEEKNEYSYIVPAKNPSKDHQSSRNSISSPVRSKNKVFVEESGY